MAATAVFWGLRLLVRPPPAPAHAVAVGESGALRGDLSRLLGAAAGGGRGNAAAAPEAGVALRLLGRDGRQAARRLPGVALIAVDGKPAKAYPVGARLDGELVLQAVSLRTASIGPAQGSPALTLELPPLPAPATGTLPSAGDGVKFGAAAVLPPAASPARRTDGRAAARAAHLARAGGRSRRPSRARLGPARPGAAAAR